MSLFTELYKEWKYWAKKSKKKLVVVSCDECSNVGQEDDFYILMDKRETLHKKVIICKGACYDPKS